MCHKYLPILKWKQGEYKALKSLDPKIKQSIIPLIEFVPVPWNFVTEKPAKIIDKHVEKIPKQIIDSWGDAETLPPIFLDFAWLENEHTLNNGKLARDYIMNGVKNEVKAIPVTGLRRSHDYQNFVKENSQNGICFRIEQNDIFNLDDLDSDETGMQELLETLLEMLGETPRNCHLVVDLGYIDGNQKHLIWPTIKNIFYEIPNSAEWDSITFAATGFPENLSGIERNSIKDIDRTEWILWKKLFQIAQKRNLRIPNFGDYAISNPKLPSIDPRFMQMSASIRYTYNKSWRIYKAQGVKKYGFDQFFELAKEAVKDEAYSGSNFSWGDKHIWKCSKKETSCGNATTWRTVSNSHHFTLVIKQLRDLLSNSCGS